MIRTIPIPLECLDLEALLDLVDIDPVDPDGCWLWRGPVNGDGYAKLDLCGTLVLAYRTLLAATCDAQIPDGLTVDHLCHNRAPVAECPGGPTCLHRRCVRPDHLDLVSPTENARRARDRRTGQLLLFDAA